MWNWCKTKGSILSRACVMSAHCHTLLLLWPLFCFMQWWKKTEYSVTRITMIIFKFRLGQFIRIYLTFRLIFVYFHLLHKHSAHFISSPGSLQASCFLHNCSISLPNDVVILTDVKHDMRTCASAFSGDDALYRSCSCEWNLQSSCQSYPVNGGNTQCALCWAFLLNIKREKWDLSDDPLRLWKDWE